MHCRNSRSKEICQRGFFANAVIGVMNTVLVEKSSSIRYVRVLRYLHAIDARALDSIYTGFDSRTTSKTKTLYKVVVFWAAKVGKLQNRESLSVV